jgi:hypothetical protein
MSMLRSRLRTGVVMIPLLLLLTLATGSVPASAQVQNRLQLHDIVCHRGFDLTGSSELYLKVGNQRIWKEDGVDPGETHSLEGVTWLFSDSMVLVLMEDDFGPDDNLGALRVNAFEAYQGTRTAVFFTNQPNCTITYDVVFAF